MSALVVQDYLGGKIIRYSAAFGDKKENHYINQLENGELFDSTLEQFSGDTIMHDSPPVDTKSYGSVRDKLLSNVDTKQRYELLSKQVRKHLIGSK